MASAEEDKKGFLTHAQCAMVFGVEPRTITKWCNEYGMPKENRGQYNLIAVVQWRCNYLEKKIKTAEQGGSDGINQDTRLKRANAEIKEMHLAELRGEMVNIDEVMPILNEGFSNIRRKASTFAQTVSPQLEGMESYERTEYLKTAIEDLFEDLSGLPNTLKRIVKLDQQSAAEGVQNLSIPPKDDGKRTRRVKKNIKR